MWLRPLQDMARLSQVVLGQCADVPLSGTATQEVVSPPVTFDNLPGPCTFRLAGGRLTGPFGRTIPATVDAPGGGPAVTVKATVGADLSGTFWGLIEAFGAPGGPAVAVRPVVLVVP
jgi:hypothetical protein